MNVRDGECESDREWVPDLVGVDEREREALRETDPVVLRVRV